MFNIDEKTLKNLREKYTKGSKVKLIQMDDPYVTIPKGTMGIVSKVDDTGTIHVSWETGSSLGIVYGVDKCELIERMEENYE